MRRQRRDRAIGLRKCQALRRLAGDALLVEGIEQRQAIRLPREDPLKQDIECRRGVGMGHGIISVLHPAFATRFPAKIRSTRWLSDVLSDSTARSIAPAR